MKILHCIHSLNPKGGGPAEFIKQCTLLQKDFGIEIEILCLDQPNSPWLNDFPAAIHALGEGRSGYGYSQRWLPWLRQHHQRFDITVIDGLWQYSSAGTRKALKPLAAPYVVFPHGMLDPWFNEHYPLKAIKKQLYWLLSEQKVLQDANAVLFTSMEERDRARNSFRPYIAKEKIAPYGTLPPNLNLESCREKFLNRFVQLKNKNFLLFFGRIHEKKGCDLLLKAFAAVSSEYPEWQLVMAGPASEYANKLQSEFTKNSTVWTGMLNDELKWGALSAASAFVLPSHQENFARAASEALSCGTPTLLSKRVNIWREIILDEAGIAENDDLPGTILLLRHWLSKTVSQQQQTRIKALACYEKRFNMRATFPEYLRLLESCLTV
ncbi:MAG: glycosyltransferase [Candidatus Obscuribacterales bacterium]|nr:glycosyltransferase [Candidatus Obscuribacterales bacterium]